MSSIQRIQPADELGVVVSQNHLVVPAIGGLAGPPAISPLLKKSFGGPVTHQLGKALVERSGALHVQRVMRDLVKNRGCELDRIGFERRGKQGIVEPSQCRERRGRTEVGIEASGYIAGFLLAG